MGNLAFNEGPGSWLVGELGGTGPCPVGPANVFRDMANPGNCGDPATWAGYLSRTDLGCAPDDFFGYASHQEPADPAAAVRADDDEPGSDFVSVPNNRIGRRLTPANDDFGPDHIEAVRPAEGDFDKRPGSVLDRLHGIAEQFVSVLDAHRRRGVDEVETDVEPLGEVGGAD